MAKNTLLITAVSGFLAVVFGAFGAHGLKHRLSADMLAVYHTGVQYQFYHTLALFGVALLMLQLPQSVALRWSAALFTAGIVVFSGSLYVLAISGVRWLGAVTPLGGVAFLAGWVLLGVAVWGWKSA